MKEKKKNRKKLEGIVDKIDTPAYIYDQNLILAQINTLKSVLPQYINILYSVKANSNIHIIKLIKDKVYGVEVCSMGEIYLALEAGVKAEKIVFVGPAKTVEEIEYAIDRNIAVIVVESLRELKLIDDIATSKRKKIEVILRVNLLNKTSKSAIRMAGGAKQFGIDEEVLRTNLGTILRSICNVDVIGIHCYSGTQNLDSVSINDNIKSVLEFASFIHEKFSLEMRVIDVGGGLGIETSSEEKGIDLIELKRLLDTTFERYKYRINSKCEFFLESGRFIIGPSGKFVCEVIDIKKSRGQLFILVDGGTNCGPNSYSSGRFLRRNPIITFTQTSHTNKVC